MNNISEAITNLEISMQSLDKFVNDPKNYNSAYASYLEGLSWEIYKKTNELKVLEYHFGDF